MDMRQEKRDETGSSDWLVIMPVLRKAQIAETFWISSLHDQ